MSFRIMSTTILASAVIPFYEYNADSYKELNETLDTVAPRFQEVIVVVDNPTVPFKDSLIKQEHKHNMRVIKHEENLGCLASRVSGWLNTRTEFVMNIDCGDVLDKRTDIRLMCTYARECIPSLIITEYDGDKLLGEDLSCPKNYMGGSSICGKLYQTVLLKDLVNKYPILKSRRINNKEDMLASFLLRCTYPKLKYSTDPFFGNYIYQRSSDSISNFVSYKKILTENAIVLKTIVDCVDEKTIRKLQGKADSNWRHFCKCFVDYEYALEKMGRPTVFPQIKGMRMREFYDSKMTKVEEKTESSITRTLSFDGAIHSLWKKTDVYERL